MVQNIGLSLYSNGFDYDLDLTGDSLIVDALDELGHIIRLLLLLHEHIRRLRLEWFGCGFGYIFHRFSLHGCSRFSQWSFLGRTADIIVKLALIELLRLNHGVIEETILILWNLLAVAQISFDALTLMHHHTLQLLVHPKTKSTRLDKSF